MSNDDQARQASARRVLDGFKSEQPEFFREVEVRQRVHECCQAATFEDLTVPQGKIVM